MASAATFVGIPLHGKREGGPEKEPGFYATHA